MEKRRDAGTSCLDVKTKAERSNIYTAIRLITPKQSRVSSGVLRRSAD